MFLFIGHSLLLHLSLIHLRSLLHLGLLALHLHLQFLAFHLHLRLSLFGFRVRLRGHHLLHLFRRYTVRISEVLRNPPHTDDPANVLLQRVKLLDADNRVRHAEISHELLLPGLQHHQLVQLRLPVAGAVANVNADFGFRCPLRRRELLELALAHVQLLAALLLGNHQPVHLAEHHFQAAPEVARNLLLADRGRVLHQLDACGGLVQRVGVHALRVAVLACAPLTHLVNDFHHADGRTSQVRRHHWHNVMANRVCTVRADNRARTYRQQVTQVDVLVRHHARSNGQVCAVQCRPQQRGLGLLDVLGDVIDRQAKPAVRDRNRRPAEVWVIIDRFGAQDAAIKAEHLNQFGKPVIVQVVLDILTPQQHLRRQFITIRRVVEHLVFIKEPCRPAFIDLGRFLR